MYIFCTISIKHLRRIQCNECLKYTIVKFVYLLHMLQHWKTSKYKNLGFCLTFVNRSFIQNVFMVMKRQQ